MDALERHVLDAVPVGLQVWEAVGADVILRYANPEADRQAGFEVSGRVGQTFREVFPGEGEWLERVHQACVEQRPRTLELAYDDERLGGRTWWRAQVKPLGERRILAAYTNVTEHHQRERDLRASERLNREILAGLQEGVMVVDTEAHVVVANEAAARLFGMALDEFAGKPLSAIPVDLLDDRGRLLEPDKMPLMRALRGEEVRSVVVRLVRRDGSLLWVEAHSNPLLGEDGVLYGAVASYDDVTTRVEEDRRTRHEADTDPLTGLANRRALERALDAAMGRARIRSRSVALLMLDLDGFKAVNDQYGHAAGDAVLREVARRLRRTVRERDVVARLGGDEFVVVLTDVGGRSRAAADSVERVEAALAEPFTVGGVALGLRAALGVALFPDDASDVQELFAHADRAMYVAKAGNGSLR
jgi:diguanylate cyclase (GGDEF)-like protein/PAS domain S-box-containing protein